MKIRVWYQQVYSSQNIYEKVKKSFGDTEFCDYLCCIKPKQQWHAEKEIQRRKITSNVV